MSLRNVLNFSKSIHIQKTCWKLITYNIQQKLILSSSAGFTKPFSKEETVAKRTKKPAIPKITLISPDNSILITSIEEAQKISTRRDLKLVKIIDLDTKTQRPVFKLMTGAEYHAEDLKRREERKNEKNVGLKGEKLLTISSRITDHDLIARVNNILKWIKKKYEVRVVINSEGNMPAAEKVYKFLEDHCKDQSRFLQKRTKGNDVKFQIIPPKKDADTEKPS